MDTLIVDKDSIKSCISMAHDVSKHFTICKSGKLIVTKKINKWWYSELLLEILPKVLNVIVIDYMPEDHEIDYTIISEHFTTGIHIEHELFGISLNIILNSGYIKEMNIKIVDDIINKHKYDIPKDYPVFFIKHYGETYLNVKLRNIIAASTPHSLDAYHKILRHVADHTVLRDNISLALSYFKHYYGI